MKTLSRPASAASICFGAHSHQTLKDYHMNPKVAVYQTNGTGRDTYINFNNGGFRNIISSSYRKDFSSLPADLSKATNINPKFPIYKSNGYGRDSYIYSTSGGFFKVPPKLQFKKSLREYDCFIRRKKYDYIYYANHFMKPKDVFVQDQLFKLQRSASTRLARPKSGIGGMYCTKHLNFNNN